MIATKRLCTRRRICHLLAGMFVILSVVACGEGAMEETAYPAEEEAVEEEAVEEEAVEEETSAEETPTEEPTPTEAATAVEPGVTLIMAVPEYLAGEEFEDTVYEPFRQNTEFGLEIIPLGDYFAGEEADVGVLSHNQLASLLNQGQLASLNELEAARTRDFVGESLALHTFGGEIYGLPWLRSGCAPAYENLSAFNLEKQEAIDSLFFHMTDPEIQLQINEMRGWLPTTEQAYSELGLTCETVNLLPLDPALVEEAVNQMQASAEALQGVLGDQVLAPGAATAVPVEGEVVAYAAPVAINIPDREAIDRLESDQGVTVGALSLLEGADLDLAGDYEVTAGDYAVTCRQVEEAMCTLTSPENGEIEVFASRFQDGLPSVVFPVVTAEEGSSDSCFWLDGFKICLWLG